jgi:hypothetical protein
LIGSTIGGSGFRTDLGDLINIDPQLGPLQDNGGPTWTHALLAGSPAIDAGDPTVVYDPNEYDQRGAPYARVDVLGGQRIDIGAYELHPPAALAGDYNLNGVVDAADYVVWRKTLNGSVIPYTGADGNGDCKADEADRVVWRAHFSQTLPPPGAAVGTDGVAMSSAITTSPTTGRASDAAFDSYGRARPRGPETNAHQVVIPQSTIRNSKAGLVRHSSPDLSQVVTRDELLFARLSPVADDDHADEKPRQALVAAENPELFVDLQDYVFELIGNQWKVDRFTL